LNKQAFAPLAFVLICLISIVAAAPASAQLTETDFEGTGEPNAEYEDAVSGKRLQTDVLYVRPGVDFRADQQVEVDVPEPVQEVDPGITTSRWFWGIIFAIILGVVIAIVISQGGAIGVSFGAKADETRRRPDEAPAEPDPYDALNRQPMDQFLQSLKVMKDRRMALILLVSRALERAADSNNVRLGRAQTARDVIRILPRSWQHLQVLRGLVRQAEVVHFGGRDVSEDQWQECFDAAMPIFDAGRAAA
jgi:hypothetical protein